MGLSEESQVANLQEKLLEIEKSFTNKGVIPLFVGVFFLSFFQAFLGLFVLVSGTVFSENTILAVRGFSFLVGAFLFIIGLIVSIHYYGQRSRYYKELKTKFPYAIPICLYCKKTLPKDNSKFCNNCGKPISNKVPRYQK